MAAFLLLALAGFGAETAWAQATVTSVDIVSNAGTDNTYKVGDEILVDVTYSAVVYVQANEDEGVLELILDIGQHNRRATFIDGSGSSDMKLHFRYTVQYGDYDGDGISIANGTDSLVGGIIVDGSSVDAGRGFTAEGADSSHKVDGISPMPVDNNPVVIASTPDQNQTYGLGEDIEVTVTFDENVHVDETVSELVLVLSIGQHSRQATFIRGSGTPVLRFSYTVARGDEDKEDGISIGAGPGSLQGASIQDFAGNPVIRTFDALPADDTQKVDGVTPSLNAVTVESTPASNGFYALNETIEVQVRFGEKVHVDQTETDLVLVVAIGQHSRSAALADGSGTETLVFRYVVQADDNDDDGISVGPNALQGGVIEDAAGNPADRTFAGVTAPNTHKVDGVRASMKSVGIASNPVANQTYGLNEEIRVEVDFDEEVHVDETDGELVLVLAIGQHSRQATFVDGSGTEVLAFSYVVQADDRDTDGISAGPSALQGAVVEDKAGNLVDRTFAGLQAQDQHKVDGRVISRAPIRIVSTPAASGTYGQNEEIRVRVYFGETVNVTGTVTLTLSIGLHERSAVLIGGNGTDTLTFRYVVQSDDEDEDGISIGDDALVGGMIKNGAGDEVDRAITRLDPDSGHRVDGISPALSGVQIVSRPDSGSYYVLNEAIRVAVEFGEVVHVTDPEQSPTLLLSIGENLREATLAGGSGTDTLTFSYVVQSDDYDDDGISIGANALEGGGIEDTAGNSVERTFAGLPAASGHRVDGVVPVLNEVRIESPPGHDGFYGVNEEITIKLEFGEEVHIKEPVTVDINIGPHTREATYVIGSGTDTLTFRYVVQSDDQDDDGISIPPDCLNGIVRDAAGNDVDATYRGLPPNSRHKVDGANTARLLVSIIAPDGHDGIFALNEEIRVEVVFPEEVHVTGTPTLTLAIGENSRTATLTDGSGTDTLTFRYVVQADDQDDDGISIGPNALVGGVIQNTDGNEVARPFGGLTADSDHRVDGVRPSLTDVRIVSPDGHDGIYGLNDEIRVEIDFGEEVHVTGDVSLALSIGEHLRVATLVGGSGTDRLTFGYAVQAGDADDDGISIGPNALQGTGIQDAAGNPVVIAFDGLAADDDHKVDGVSPSLTAVRIVSPDGHDGIYGLNDEIRVEIDFGEEVHVTGDVSLALSIGEHLRVATLVGGSGTDRLTFGYAVQAGDADDDGISIGPNALQGTGIQDAAGNPVVIAFDGLAADDDHKVDGVSPSLTAVRIVSPDGHDGIYGRNEEIRVEVDFGEEVHVTGDVSLALSIGEHLRVASLVGGSGTDSLTFGYVVQAGDADDDGISIGPNALQGTGVRDAAGNPVVIAFDGLAADDDHKVDGVSPSLTAVRIVSPDGHDGIYGLNEEIRVEVDFGEEVHVTGDVSLALSIGEHLRVASLVGGSGTDRLTFSYLVQLGDADDDGISIGPNALQGTGVQDAAGNPVVIAFDGLAADDDHRVDGVNPSLTRVWIAAPQGHDGTYIRDEAITVRAQFGEDVHVTSGEAELAIMLSIGQNLRAAAFVEGSGTDTLTFRYVVQAGDSDEDGISIGPNALQGGTIEDAAGNAVVRTFNGLPADVRYKVKAIAAVVARVEEVVFRSNAGSNDTYTTDDDILLDVVFNVPVYVTGEAPILELSIGSVSKHAVFQEGSGTRILKFLYTVGLGDTDDDGISIGPNALIGAVEDEGGNAVDLTLPALEAQSMHKVSAELMLYPLSLTLLVGQSEIIDLSNMLGDLEVDYDGRFEATSDDSSIATAAMSGRMLTIASVAEGAATITAKAVDASIYLVFGVTVATSPEEKAVLEGALAAVGRGLIASAASTIGARLESSDSDSPDVWGGRGLAPGSEVAPPQWTAFDRIDRLANPFDDGRWGDDDLYLERSVGYTLGQWLRGARFEMPFGGFGNPIHSWSVWGAGDWHAFEGEPESGLYNGSLTSIYLGVDAKGNGWISGAAFSHAIADASYEFGGDYGGEGRLETELNVVHPYVQWAFRERGKMWAILGFGAGEATAEREGQEASRTSSDLSMLMGLGGIRYAFGPIIGFDFAIRGDAGFARLETDEGPRAIEGMMVNVQRLRMGVEASLPMALAGVPVSPFIDVAGRYDGGDGATGGGVELAGGFRYRGPMVGVEVKGRALAMHTDDSYSEEGVKATLIVGPDGRRGFRLTLAPRWGGTAEAMDIFSYRGHPFAGALRRDGRGWGLGTRVSYGFDMRRRLGTVMPYWELDLSRDTYRRARLGVSYELASAFMGLPHRLEISGESTESDQHGSIMRFLLSGQAHF